MELNQSNNQNLHNEDAVAELLTLTCEIGDFGNKFYLNKEGQYHRIHGPAYICTGAESWWKNGKRHRTDGPAITSVIIYGYEEYWIDGNQYTKGAFIQWQKDNGIKPVK